MFFWRKKGEATKVLCNFERGGGKRRESEKLRGRGQASFAVFLRLGTGLPDFCEQKKTKVTYYLNFVLIKKKDPNHLSFHAI